MRNSLLKIVLCLFVVLTGCVHSAKQQNANKLNWEHPHKNLEFISHQEWLGLQLPYAPFEKLRKQIEAKTGLSLKNRGEAHITVLTPPEFQKLKIEMSVIENAVKDSLQKSNWTAACVGVGKKDALQTYFIVIDSPELFAIREKIKNLAPSFAANHFYPHVTLGFTERDLHEQDGVIKDKKLCQYELTEGLQE